jgi:hypothetical protein
MSEPDLRKLERMRYRAGRAGKAVPSMELLLSLWRDDCERCGKALLIKAPEVRGYVPDLMTLQHNFDGTFSLWCWQCNVAHGFAYHRSRGRAVPPWVERARRPVSDFIGPLQRGACDCCGTAAGCIC